MKLFVSAKLFLVRYRLQTAQRLIQNDLLSFRFDGQGSPSPLGYVGQTWNLCLDPVEIMAYYEVGTYRNYHKGNHLIYHKEQTVSKELVIHVRHLPDFKNAEVVVRPVSIREYDGIKCFVTSGEEFETKKLPNDFYLREFIDLNEDNVDELLAFQEEYGLISSSLERKPDNMTQLFQVGAQFQKDKLGIENEYAAIRVTDGIREPALGEMLLSYMETNSVEEEARVRSNAISIDETRACVKNLKVAIRALVEAAENGVIEAEGNYHYILSSFAVDYITQYVDRSFKTISLMSEADAVYAGKNVSIMAMLAAQCLYGIQTKQHGDYVFKTCLCCNHVFQFGRTGEDGGNQFRPRPSASKFCSPACQKKYSTHKVDENGKRLY